MTDQAATRPAAPPRRDRRRRVRRAVRGRAASGIDPEVAVTLVDRRNFHLFQPMLYQVATGALSPGEIAQPLRSVLRKQRNTTVILGEAVGLDVERPRGASCRTAARSPTTR